MIELAPYDTPDCKPFTHTCHTTSDVCTLEHVRRSLASYLDRAADDAAGGQRRIELTEPGGRAIRHVVVRPQGLCDHQPLVVVGFCGCRYKPTGRRVQEEMAQVDADLVDELSQHTHMLSYSSIEAGDGDWHNLVLMSHGDASAHWRHSARHGWAVASLSPRFYQHIRLHNGRLPQGLMTGDLVLTSTKYYEFGADNCAPWQAVRRWS